MKISVVISSYNRAELLPRSIGSVLKQSCQDFEIIVVDDGSTDNTGEVMKEFARNDSRIKYIRLNKNQGVQAARNRGLEEATGDFINILDSDDELYPNAFEETIAAFSNDRDIVMVSAPYEINGKVLTSFKKDESGYIEYTDLLCQRNVRAQKGGYVTFKRSCVGGIRYMAQNLDFIFYRRLAKKGKMYFIAKPLGIYHKEHESDSLSAHRSVPNVELSIKRARALDEFLVEFKADYLKYCPKFLSMYSYGTTVGLLLDNKKTRALHYAWLMLKYNPSRIKYYIFSLFILIPFSSNILRWLFRVKRFFILKDQERQ